MRRGRPPCAAITAENTDIIVLNSTYSWEKLFAFGFVTAVRDAVDLTIPVDLEPRPESARTGGYYFCECLK